MVTIANNARLDMSALYSLDNYTPSDLANLDSASFSTIRGSAIRALTTSQISKLSATAIKTILSSSAYKYEVKYGASYGRGEFVLSVYQLQAISPDVIANLDAADLTSLQLGQNHSLTNDQLKKIEPKVIQGLGVNIGRMLSDSNISALAAPQINKLTSTQLLSIEGRLARFSKDQVQAISPDAIAGMDKSTARMLRPGLDSFGRLVGSFSAEQINKLTSTQAVQLFKTQQIAGIGVDEELDDRNQVPCWTLIQYEALSTEAREKVLSYLQGSYPQGCGVITLWRDPANSKDPNAPKFDIPINLLSYKFVQALDKSHIKNLKAGQLNNLLYSFNYAMVGGATGRALNQKPWGADQISAIEPSEIALINCFDQWGAEGVAALTPTQIGNLTAAQVNMMLRTPGVRDVFANIYKPILDRDGNPTGKLNPLGVLGGGPGISLEKFQALSAKVIAGLDINYLAPTSLCEFSALQVGAITGAQMTAILNKPSLKPILLDLGGAGTHWSLDQYGNLSASAQEAIKTYANNNRMAMIATTTYSIPIAFLNVGTFLKYPNEKIVDLKSYEILAILQAFPSIININAGSGWSPTQLQNIKPDEIPKLGNLIVLFGPAIAWFTSGQIGRISSSQFTELLGAQSTKGVITTLSNSGASTGHWSPAQFGALSPDVIAHLTLSQIKALTLDQIKALTTAQIKALTPDQIKAFTAVQIKAFTAVQIGAMTTDQIGAMTPDQIEALTPDQIEALTPDLATDQIRVLNPNAILGSTSPRPVVTEITYSDDKAHLSYAQLGALSPEVIAHLTPDQIKALTPAQIGAMTTAQIGALTTVQFNVILGSTILRPVVTEITISGDRAHWSYAQFGALSLDVIAHLTPAQIKLFTLNITESDLRITVDAGDHDDFRVPINFLKGATFNTAILNSSGNEIHLLDGASRNTVSALGVGNKIFDDGKSNELNVVKIGVNSILYEVEDGSMRIMGSGADIYIKSGKFNVGDLQSSTIFIYSDSQRSNIVNSKNEMMRDSDYTARNITVQLLTQVLAASNASVSPGLTSGIAVVAKTSTIQILC